MAKTAPAHKGLRPQSPARRSEEQGSAQRGAGSPESGRGAPVIFGDLTSQAIVGGDPLRLTRVASPNKIGAPAPPRQPPRLRDATVEPIVGASSNADPTRVSGVRSPRGPSFRPTTRPLAGMGPRRRAQDRGIGALLSRSGVASKHTPLGTCSALHGTFVARLANTASIGCTSLRAIDDSVSQRARVSSCYGLPEGAALSTELPGQAGSLTFLGRPPSLPLRRAAAAFAVEDTLPPILPCAAAIQRLDPRKPSSSAGR